MARKVLLTGADGYLGRRIAARLLKTTDARLVVWMRADSRQALETKKARYLLEFGAYSDRLVFHGGQLEVDSAFDGMDGSEITHIVHAAAVTVFGVEEQVAQAVNIGGTERLARFALGCHRLQQFVQLSTIYASGLQSGRVPEALLERPVRFANHYEASKWMSETLLAERFGAVPWRIARVATVVADDASGAVNQVNVVHRMLRLLYTGLLPIVPGNADTPLYLVDGEFVVDALIQAVLDDSAAVHDVVNICHDAASAAQLSQVLDTAYTCFQTSEAFRARGVLKPLISDQAAFDYMADHVQMFSDRALGHAVGLMRPFAKQMYVAKDVENARVASLRSFHAQDQVQLVEAVCRWLMKHEWGASKRPDGTASHAARAQ